LPAGLQGTDILKDDMNNYLLPRKGLIRFNDPHPMHATEDFFFNFMLAKQPFRTLDQLLTNGVDSYNQQCVLNGYISAGNASEVCVHYIAFF